MVIITHPNEQAEKLHARETERTLQHLQSKSQEEFASYTAKDSAFPILISTSPRSLVMMFLQSKKMLPSNIRLQRSTHRENFSNSAAQIQKTRNFTKSLQTCVT
jgi:hypothetical protein